MHPIPGYALKRFLNSSSSMTSFPPNRANSVVALLTVLLAAGCSSQPERSAPQPDRAAKSASLPVDALLADALRRQVVQHDTTQALQMLAAAAGRAPERADIAWLHSQLCAQVSGCEPESAEARLRKLDPGNGVAWLGALRRARARGDTAATSQILAAMGRSEYFNLYWNSLTFRVGTALSQQATGQKNPQKKPEKAPQKDPKNPVMDPLTSGLNEVVGWLSSLALPAFQPIKDACNGNSPSVAQARASCLQISDAMRRSDTYIVEGLGLGIAQRLAPAASQASNDVETQIELARYQRETATDLIDAQVDHEKFSQQLVELMKKLPREQDVFLTVLRWSGVSLTP
jgi:hypothetical protein